MPYGRWVLHLKLEPKLSQPKAKAAIHDIWQAETKVDAEKAFDLLIKTYDPNILLAMLNSVVTLPAAVLAIAVDASGWLLLTAIAAVGLKTRPAEILKVGKPAAALLAAETLFLAVGVALALKFLPILST